MSWRPLFAGIIIGMLFVLVIKKTTWHTLRNRLAVAIDSVLRIGTPPAYSGEQNH